MEFRSNLVRQREILLTEVSRIDSLIESIDKILAQPIRHSDRGPRQGTIKSRVLQIIQAQDGPIHANDVMAALRAQGVPLSDKDPKATVVTALLRLAKAGHIRKLGGNRFARLDNSDKAPSAD